MTAKKPTSLDPEDLLALDMPFSQSPSARLPSSPPKLARASPVKPHNKQFEQDFESDFSESQQSIDAPVALNRAATPKKLPDLEEIFASDFGISAPETSSPSYHYRETLYPQIPQPSTILPPELAREEAQPIASSTQQNSLFYPSLSKSVLEYNSPTKKRKTPPAWVEYKKPKKSAEPQEKPAQRPTAGYHRARQSFRGASPTSIVKTINSLITRPKMEPQLALLTQRPVMGEQSRGMATASNAKRVQAYSLSQEQLYIKNLVMSGESLFYTGSAGTGKSVLLRELIKSLRAIHHNNVAVTASTGLAAVNIGGITLHSFAGIGLGNDPAEDLVKKIKRNRKSLARWKQVKVLIVDEVSMISAELFDKLDHIACEIRNNHLPFGGIQVVCCGDFFQLPPVSNEFTNSRFCFESHSWKRTMKNTLTLKEVFRQKGDMEFIDMLNDMRRGVVTEKSMKNFQALSRDLPDGVEPTELFSTREEVEKANSYRLQALKTPIHYYQAMDKSDLDPDRKARLLANFMAPENLELKKGAQVMMIKNIDSSLVNGSLGKVIDFIDRDTYLAYESVKNGELNEQELEEFVADSLKKPSKEDIGIVNGVEEHPHYDTDVDVLENTVFDFLRDASSDDEDMQNGINRKKELVSKLYNSSRGQKLPLVRFITPDRETRTILVHPETWTVEDEKQKPIVSRMQLPLMLAWALSIHKSQGQTIPRVRVNLARIFEKGQAYVAISRAVDREGLQILNFDQSKVFAHPKVIAFYSTLENPADMAGAAKEDEAQEYFDASDIIPDELDLPIDNAQDYAGPPPGEEFEELPMRFDNLPNLQELDESNLLIIPPRRRARTPFDMDLDPSWEQQMTDDSVVSRVASQ